MSEKDKDQNLDDAKDKKDQDIDKKDDAKDKKEDDKITVPKSTWDQNYARMKKAEDDAEALRKEKTDREEADAREKGQFKELADKHKAEADAKTTEVETLKKSVEEADAVFSTMLTERMEGFSDEQKAAVEGLDGFSVRQKLNFISNHKALFDAKKAGGNGEKPQPNSDAKKPDDEITGLEAERDAIIARSKGQGGLSPADSKRSREIGSKLAALRAAKP